MSKHYNCDGCAYAIDGFYTDNHSDRCQRCYDWEHPYDLRGNWSDHNTDKCFICHNSSENPIQVLIPRQPAVHLCADCADGLYSNISNISNLRTFLDKPRKSKTADLVFDSQMEATGKESLTVEENQTCITCGNAMNSDYRCARCFQIYSEDQTVKRTNWYPKEEENERNTTD